MKLAFLPIKRNSPFGGSEVLWSKTALVAHKEGHEVHLYPYAFVNQNPNVINLQKAGAKVFPRTLRNLSVPVMKRAIRRLEAIINRKLNRLEKGLRPLLKERYDLLIVSQGSWYDMADDVELMRAIDNKPDLPFVIICHSFQDTGLLSKSRRDKIRKVYKKAHQVYFVSNRQKKVVEKYLCLRIPNSKVIHNPVSFEWEKPLSFPGGPLKLVMISSLVTRWKGHDLLLEALSCEEWKQRDWQLEIYGSGEDEEQIKELIDFYGLQNYVILRGYANNIAEAMAGVHAMVIPSRVEAAPLVLYEAFLCGRPVVATDIGDMGLLIDDGVNGFLAEAPLPKYIREALNRLWKNRHSLESMGQNGFALAASSLNNKPEKVLLNHLEENAQG